MVFPQPFTTASQAIVSYDFTDIENGIGINRYYAGATEDSTGITYILTDSNLPGARIDANNYATINGNAAEVDFDLTSFSVPKTVKGTMLVSFHMYSDGTNATCKVQLKKLSGAVETDVSSQITSTTETATKPMLLKVPLTETLFAAGDILRLSVDFNGTNIGQGIGIDPSGTSSSTATVTLNPFIIEVPFKLDL